MGADYGRTNETMNAMDNPGKFTPDDYIIEAAPGVVRDTVEAVARKTTGSVSYAKRQKIHPMLPGRRLERGPRRRPT